MLDLPKAMDGIISYILFMKLRETELPTMNIRLLEYMIVNAFVNISFIGCKESDWLICNSARQVGILSPLSFNFHINGINESILQKSVGC